MSSSWPMTANSKRMWTSAANCKPMNTMKKILLLITVLVSALVASSQQDLQVSQYMFNGLLLNPAYAGSHPYFSTSLLHRSQWVNFDNAPTSQVFSLDGPVANDKLGVGLLVTNDQHGIIRQLNVGLNGAYRMDLGNGNLALGLKVGFGSYTADLSDVVIWDEDDQVYSVNNLSGEFITQVGFGVYYHTDRWFAGVSVPTFESFDDNVLLQGSVLEKYFTRHVYGNAGIVFEPSPSLAIKPSVLVKYEAAAPVEVDINCNFLLYQKLWLGAGYRTGDAAVGMIEYNITPQLRAGYAYDFTLSDLSTYVGATHEIMLGFDFGRQVDIKTRSPRYF